MSENIDIQALSVAFQIIDALAKSKDPMSVSEIGRALAMTAPRAWRYVNSLENLGVIETKPHWKGYSLGWKLRQLGQNSINRINPHEAAYYYLDRLKDQLLETVYLSVPSGDGASVIMSFDGGDGTYVSIHVSPGAYFHPTSTPSGRLILAFSSEEKLQRVISKGLSVEGPDPIHDVDSLVRRLELIRSRKYDVAIGTSAKMRHGKINLNSVVAPVFDKDNKICAVVGVLTGMGENDIVSEEFLTPVLHCAKEISKSLGSSFFME